MDSENYNANITGEKLPLKTIPEDQPNTHQSGTYAPKLAEALPKIDDFQSFDPDTLPKDFFGVIAAPRRHGKTTALCHMLRHWHKSNRFTHILVWSKTLSGYEEYIPAPYQFDDLDNMKLVIERQQDVGEYNSQQQNVEDMVHSSILLVLDDMAADQKGLRSGGTGEMLLTLATNGRHVTRRDKNKKNECSVIILTQRLTLLPAPVRCNSDFILTSRLANRAERERVAMENLTLHSGRFGMREAYHVLDEITLSKPYRMCVVCMHKAERQNHKDYVYYLDADNDAQAIRLFGSESDWQKKLKRIRF